MQNAPDIENTDVSMNQEFSVLSFYNFTRSNPQIT